MTKHDLAEFEAAPKYFGRIEPLELQVLASKTTKQLILLDYDTTSRSKR